MRNRNKLIAYALDFASFLVESGIEPRRIILFGSVTTGEFDKESDIDIFIDTDRSEENNIKRVLKIFDKTFGEKWRLKGINNPISLKIGDLNKWRNLKRSIQSYGIVLYGAYNEVPDDIKSYLFFRLAFGSLSRAKKVSAWRKLYGYTQKIGKKKYEQEGIVKYLGGKKLDKSIVIPTDKSKKFKDFLKKNKISFSVNEVWSDNL